MAAPKPKPLTLTQLAYALRRGILVGGILLVVLIVGRMFLSAAIGYWRATHPAAPPPPTVGFGILAKLQFPPSVGEPKSYKLELPPSRQVVQSDREFVYFIPSRRANLLALDRAKKHASALGFTFLEPEKVSDQVYRWRRSSPMSAILDYNTVTGTFRYLLDWQSNPAYLSENRVPKEDDAISAVKQVLANADLLERDIATGSAKITYLKASGGSYTKTVSLSESDFLQVDLFRSAIRGAIPVVTEQPDRGTIRAVISGTKENSQRLALIEYNYLPIDYTSAHTYPIISPTQAFELLRAKQGYVAAMSEGQTDVIIRDINLAFYDSGKEQQYLQPIYVLTGDGGFVGYVSAILPTWIAK